MSGTTIIASGSNGVPGTWTERGWRCAWLARTASPWSTTQPLIPDAERALVGEDQVGEPVAGDDRAADAGGPVDLVDGQRVVRHDRPQRIGDEVEHAGGLERRQQPLVDLEQSSLALELVLELVLLAAQPLHVGAVDQGLGRIAGEDRQGHLVVGVELVGAVLRDDDDPVDDAVEQHRDEEHRLRPIGRLDDERPRIRHRVAEPHRFAVRGHPAGQARRRSRPGGRHGSGSVPPMNVPWKPIGSHIPVS